LAGAHSTDEVLDLMVNEATRLVGAKAAFIRLLQGGVGVPAAATASAAGFLAELKKINPAITVEEGKTGAGHVMATMKPLVFDDVAKAEIVPTHTRLLAKKHGFYGIVTIPLVVNSQSIGLFSVYDGSVRLFTDDEVSLLTAFADQAALALEKARLLNEAETERERADSLYRVSNLLAGAHDTDEVLDLIVN
jgi:GAF domain-containing protein